MCAASPKKFEKNRGLVFRSMNIQKKALYTSLLIFIAAAAPTIAQTPVPLFWLADEPYYADDFSYAFNKNRQAAEGKYTIDELNDYFDLYVRFRLKVKEAKTLGYDRQQAFAEEMAGYRRQLAKPYLAQNAVTELLIKEAYERTLEEVEASHILIEIPAQAAPADTAEAYNQLVRLRESIMAGRPFGEVAAQVSDDPSAVQNKGYLGFFGAFQMVYPFESAAFSTPAGGVSLPFRTSFGYHLVKVHARRKALGSVKLAHIYFKDTNGDSTAAYAKAVDVKSRLSMGEDWTLLAARYSEELSNKDKGGELPWLAFRQLPSAFYQAAASLKPNEISSPLRAQNGWHLIKVLDRRPVPPLAEVRSMIESRISADGRTETTHRHTVDSLLKKLSARVDYDELRAAMSLVDGRLNEARWSFESDDPQVGRVLVAAPDTSLSVADFYTYLEVNQKKRHDVAPSTYAARLWEQFLMGALEDLELKRLYRTNEDYRHLFNEYYDGTLLFEIMNEKVWRMANTDTVGLRRYFSINQANYMWKQRAEILVIEGLESQLQAMVFPGIDSLFHLKSEAVSTIDQVRRAGRSMLGMGREGADSLFLFASGSQEFIQQLPASDSLKINVLKNDGAATNRNQIHWFTLSKSVLEKYFNGDDTLSLKFSSRLVERNSGDLAEQYWQRGLHFVSDGSFSRLILVRKILDEQPKRLEEIKGKVVADYQDFLEDEWVTSLQQKYPLRVNTSEWNNVRKKLNEK